MWLVYAIIAPFFFAGTNIFDSVFMNKYEKRPVVYLFYAGLVMVPMFALYSLFLDVQMKWIVLIVITTIIAYVAELFYFYLLGRIDTSVVNACWAILAIFVSIGGYFFFQERWTLLQGTGAVLILGGVLLLSYWHHHVSMLRTVALFSGVALFLTPIILVEKAALAAGGSALSVAYWTIAGRNIPDLVVPWFRAEWREGVISLPKRVHPDFFLLLLSAMLVWCAGTYAVLRAYELGLVSLTGIVGNVQPFFVIFLAWIVTFLLPRYAPP